MEGEGGGRDSTQTLEREGPRESGLVCVLAAERGRGVHLSEPLFPCLQNNHNAYIG